MNKLELYRRLEGIMAEESRALGKAGKKRAGQNIKGAGLYRSGRGYRGRGYSVKLKDGVYHIRFTMRAEASYMLMYNWVPDGGARVTQRAWSKPSSQLKQKRRRRLAGTKTFWVESRPWLREEDLYPDIKRAKKQIGQRFAKVFGEFLKESE